MNTKKTAIVTGGSKGYGRGCAEVLKEADYSVWITGRDNAALERAAADLGVRSFRADITKPEDWESLVRAVMDVDGRIDVLVNNAGAGIHIAPVDEQSCDDITASLMTNLAGAIFGCRIVVPIMKAQKGGTIINVSSICQREAWPGYSVYSAAKAGLAQFGECLYTEVRLYGIKVTTAVPSWGSTEFGKALGSPPAPVEIESKKTKPREFGELVRYICDLPAHLSMLDATLLPMVQDITPL
jgi:NAD(P)-dependent dehydrogenase (short-subunit alcohol dehydrogenase family)